MAGAVATVRAPTLPARQPDDAPAWLPTGRAVRLGDLADADALAVAGAVGTVQVAWRAAPDRYVPDTDAGEAVGAMLDLRWQAPDAAALDPQASRLEVGLDGAFVAAAPLAQRALALRLPAGRVRAGATLAVHFAARPRAAGRCAALPEDWRLAVDPASTLTVQDGARFAELPDLAGFAAAGFPFTALADLSRTAVLLPERASAAEIGAYLDLMGWFGRLTGVAATGVAVARPDAAAGLAGRDLLLVGTLAKLHGAAALLAAAGAHPQGEGQGQGLALAAPGRLAALDPWVNPAAARDRAAAATAVAVGLTDGTAALIAGESPLRGGQSVVALLAGGAPGLAAAVGAVQDPATAARIHGDLTLLGAGTLAGFTLAPRYTVGALPLWQWPAWALRDQPLAVLALGLTGVGLLGAALRGAWRRRTDRWE